MRLNTDRWRHALSFWLVIICVGAARVRAGDNTEIAHPIDTSIVLRIGANVVSRYCLEKNLRRFAPVKGWDQSRREVKQRWFELFLAKQVVIAEGLELGYDKRMEVTQIVETMERHILSQSSSSTLKYGEDDVPEERLREIYQKCHVIPNVVAARLPNEELTAWQGADWSLLMPLERIQRLEAHRGPNLELYRGPLSWPYYPFFEMESELAAAVAGAWIVHPGTTTTTLLFIKSVESKEAPPFEKRRGQFDAFAIEQLREIALRKRRAAYLSDVGFHINAEVASHLAAVLAELPPQTAEIPSQTVESFRTVQLAKYRLEQQEVSISGKDWRENFNRQLIRRIPRTSVALTENVREQVAMDLEVFDARKRGADQTPQFVEDRRNFLHNQVLDLFEKEQLLPRVVVSEETLYAYYNSHLKDFSQPDAADCVEFHFASEEKALAWLKENRAASDPSLASPEILNTNERRVSLDDPVAGPSSATEAILHMSVGSYFGPVAGLNDWVVIRTRAIHVTPLAYKAASLQVRALWTRQHLDEDELTLSRRLCSKFKIEDAIPYSEFAVFESLTKPWR